LNENPDLFADEWDARRYHAPIALSEPEQIANEHWDLMDRVALDGDDIKRLLERLWEDWEPVTLRGELLNGGDQQLTLTIRRKETK
jgi:hypothetical protein